MSKLTDYVIMPGSDYQNICNSVRSKTGGADLLKSSEVSAAIDSIQASGGGIEHKDVNFYDYDGTLLHSYTVEEAANLTGLPNLPSHEGLICQGWNYDLDTIKNYGRSVDIGAMYITDDGKTRLYIDIYSEARKDITIYYGFTGDTTVGVTINWGDGTTETVTDVGNITKIHTYESIGDYIITGGELAALVIIDSIVRLIPGVLPKSSCYEKESHFNGMLEYPQYTRPRIWHNKKVPDVLLSGHHANIENWKKTQSYDLTKKNRPDLLKKVEK